MVECHKRSDLLRSMTTPSDYYHYCCHGNPMAGSPYHGMLGPVPLYVNQDVNHQLQRIITWCDHCYCSTLVQPSTLLFFPCYRKRKRRVTQKRTRTYLLVELGS